MQRFPDVDRFAGLNGEGTRRQYKLYDERGDPGSEEGRELWSIVRRVLSSPESPRRCGTKLDEGFRIRAKGSGEGWPIPMHPRPVLYTDLDGYAIKPHPDTRRKVLTMQIYLPSDETQRELGTTIYKVSPMGVFAWKSYGLVKDKTVPFLPNTGYAFVVIHPAYSLSEVELARAGGDLGAGRKAAPLDPQHLLPRARAAGRARACRRSGVRALSDAHAPADDLCQARLALRASDARAMSTLRDQRPAAPVRQGEGANERADEIFSWARTGFPSAWYNIVADLPSPPPPVLHPGTGQPVGPADLAPLFPMALIGQEVSGERHIEIPTPVRDIYRLWRPTPLYRARGSRRRSERPPAFSTNTRASARPAATSPTPPSPRLSTTRKRASTKLSTETGAGQWGSSLAFAGALFGLEVKVYMVKVSYNQKPYRRALMETYGAKCVASPSNETDSGTAILKAASGFARAASASPFRSGGSRGQESGHQICSRQRAQPRADASDRHRPRGDRADGGRPTPIPMS